MDGIYPKIKRLRDNIFLCVRKTGNGKREQIPVKTGETVVVEGGPSTGKTDFLKKTILQLNDRGDKTLLINAVLPVTDWVKDFRLFGSNLDARIDYLLRTLPENYYLLIDNAEKITDSKKLEITLLLIEKAGGTILSCSSFNHLTGKLKVRLADARIQSLGAGADTFDITYFIVALLIVVVALTGAHGIIFLAAAFRYLFQGTRMGGRKI